MLDVHILGTSASVPTRNRNLPAILINYQGERILFDCGEGAQKTIMKEGLGLMKINKIFISHWHADHWSGLIGLIQTMSLERRKNPLYIYGPIGTEGFVKKLLEIGYYYRGYEVIAKDVKENESILGKIKKSKYEIIPFKTEHNVPSLGYVMKEEDLMKANREKMKKIGLKPSPLIKKLKEGMIIEYEGKKIKPSQIIEKVPGIKLVYTGDTSYCPNVIKFSKNADLLIHDVTLLEEVLVKKQVAHSSAKGAAETAKKAKVKKLILTHISRRYGNNSEELLKEAKKIFDNTELAYDGLHITIKSHRPEK